MCLVQQEPEECWSMWGCCGWKEVNLLTDFCGTTLSAHYFLISAAGNRLPFWSVYSDGGSVLAVRMQWHSRKDFPIHNECKGIGSVFMLNPLVEWKKTDTCTASLSVRYSYVRDFYEAATIQYMLLNIWSLFTNAEPNQHAPPTPVQSRVLLLGVKVCVVAFNDGVREDFTDDLSYSRYVWQYGNRRCFNSVSCVLFYPNTYYCPIKRVWSNKDGLLAAVYSSGFFRNRWNAHFSFSPYSFRDADLCTLIKLEEKVQEQVISTICCFPGFQKSFILYNWSY